MYKNILLPTDGSECSEEAAKKGVSLAKDLNAKVTALYVTPKLSYHDFLDVYHPDVLWGPKEAEKAKKALDDLEELNKSIAEKYLSVIENITKEAGIPCECVYITDESPTDGIIKVAKEKGCDLIFMACHGRTGIRGVLLGSVTLKVLAHSVIPVLVYR